MTFSFQDFDGWFNANNISGNTQLVERLHAVSITFFRPDTFFGNINKQCRPSSDAAEHSV